ncbi:MAG TPA: 5-bromo-4-chloroindolyl phosphate hydrolysis family protein [Spirochaetia bacterium]|nr:5-bromo-4-chloroindolyl phosphate hydrolysis family protein [Spirochaetia bacterium]
MKEIVSGGLGGVLFGVLYLALGVPLPFAAIGAGAGYVAGRFLMARAGAGAGEIGLEEDDRAAAEIIASADAQLKTFRGLISSVDKPEVRAKIQHLADLAEQIVDRVRENHRDAKRVRQFLNYYLGATVTIVQRYVDLGSRRNASGEIGAALAKVESMLDPIERVFEQQLAASAQDEVLDLDTELKLLEQTLQLEGLDRAK